MGKRKSQREHNTVESAAAAGWPWDPTRPVAGQYEEHLAAEILRADLAARPQVVADADQLSEFAVTQIEIDCDTATPWEEETECPKHPGVVIDADDNCSACAAKADLDLLAPSGGNGAS